MRRNKRYVNKNTRESPYFRVSGKPSQSRYDNMLEEKKLNMIR